MSDAENTDNGENDVEEPAPIDRCEVTNSIILRSAAASAVSGALPIPGYDVALATGIDMAMVNSLCQVYGVKFTRDTGSNIFWSLIAGATPPLLKRSVMGMLKAVPVVGSMASMATMPALNFAGTYALGKLYVRHFERLERGETSSLNFNSAKTQVFFQQQMEEGLKKYDDTPAAQPA